jgi:hypothetical protein
MPPPAPQESLYMVANPESVGLMYVYNNRITFCFCCMQHLLTFLQLYQPGPFFRAAVLGSQGVFLSLYSFFYMISPRHCHAFVSYLEEEAVKTYTRAIACIDDGRLPDWTNRPAPEIAVNYWRLGEGATMRDLLLAVRADEACHHHANAIFANLKTDDPNPFAPASELTP